MLQALNSNKGRGLQVRAIADILPEIDVVVGDQYNSNPDNPAEMGPDAKEMYHPPQPPLFSCFTVLPENVMKCVAL